MEVVITDRCVGHGMCEAIADDLFEIGDDGVSHVLASPVPADREEAADEAVRACPAQAIDSAPR